MGEINQIKWGAVHLYARLKHIPDTYAASLLLRLYIKDYKDRRYPLCKIAIIHKRGFTAKDWTFLELDNHKYQDYLSNLQYYRMHQLNGKYSYIIDSKLSLKEHCVGTPINQYLPEYYFEITSDGKLIGLSDLREQTEDIFG